MPLVASKNETKVRPVRLLEPNNGLFPLSYDRQRDEIVIGLWVEVNLRQLTTSNSIEPMSVVFYEQSQISAYVDEATRIKESTAVETSTLSFLRTLAANDYADVASTLDSLGVSRPSPVYVTEIDFTKAIPNSFVKKSGFLTQGTFVNQTRMVSLKTSGGAASNASYEIQPTAGLKVVSSPKPITVSLQKTLDISQSLASKGIKRQREFLSALTLGDPSQSSNARNLLATTDRFVLGELDFSKRFSAGDFSAGSMSTTTAEIDGLLGFVDVENFNETDASHSLVKCVKDYSQLRKVISFRVPRRVFELSYSDLIAIIVAGKAKHQAIDAFSQNALGTDGFNLITLFQRGTVSPEPATVTLNLGNSFLRVSIEQSQVPTGVLVTKLTPIDQYGNLVLTESSVIERRLVGGVEETIEFDLDAGYEKFLFSHCVRIGSNYSSSKHQIVKNEDARLKAISQRSLASPSTINLLAYHQPDESANVIEVSYRTGTRTRRIRVGRLTRAFDGRVSANDGKLTYIKLSDGNQEYTEFDLAPGSTVSLLDDDLTHDRIYEYFIEYVGTDITATRRDRSFVHYRDELKYGTAVAQMQVSLTTDETTSDLSFDVDVEYPSVGIEQVLTSLKESTAGNIVTSNANVQIGNYIDNLLNNREKFANLYRINVVMQDLTTGNEYEIGNFSAGKIKIPNRIVKLSSRGHARFVFRLLQRNASTLFNDAFEQITDPETLRQFRVQISKFFAPLVTHQSTLPSTSRLALRLPNEQSKLQLNDDFLVGYTGVTKVIETLVGAPSTIPGDDVNVSTFLSKTGKVAVSWDSSVSANVAGYLVHVSMAGASHPIAYVLANASTRYTYIDETYAATVGPRRYGISRVLGDMTVTKPVFSNVVNLVEAVTS